MFRALFPWRMLLLIIIGMVLLALYFSQYVGRVSELSPVLQQATNSIAEQVADALPTEKVPMPLVVLPFKGDYTRTLRNQLENAVSADGLYPVVTLGWLGKKLQGLGFDVPVIGDAKSAQRWGGYLGGERILWGEISLLSHADGKTNAQVTASLYNDNGAVLWTRQFPYSTETTLQHQVIDSEQAQQWGMMMLWGLATLALPFLLWPITATMLQREQNLTAAILLLSYSTISTMLAYVLGYWLDFWQSSGQILLWLVPIAVLSLWIYYLICNRLVTLLD